MYRDYMYKQEILQYHLYQSNIYQYLQNQYLSHSSSNRFIIQIVFTIRYLFQLVVIMIIVLESLTIHCSHTTLFSMNYTNYGDYTFSYLINNDVPQFTVSHKVFAFSHSLILHNTIHRVFSLYRYLFELLEVKAYVHIIPLLLLLKCYCYCIHVTLNTRLQFAQFGITLDSISQ